MSQALVALNFVMNLLTERTLLVIVRSGTSPQTVGVNEGIESVFPVICATANAVSYSRMVPEPGQAPATNVKKHGAAVAFSAPTKVPCTKLQCVERDDHDLFQREIDRNNLNLYDYGVSEFPGDVEVEHIEPMVLKRGEYLCGDECSGEFE